MEITLRKGRNQDILEISRVVYEAFKTIALRHNFPPDFPTVDVASGLMSELISRDDVHALVAERDGCVLGSNFLWEGDAVAGVGPITVDPGAQNDTIGRQLMTAVLKRAAMRRFTGVRLVQAAYHNRSLALYTKLGFDAREPLSLMQGQLTEVTIPGRSVRIASNADLDRCNALGTRILGYDRGTELKGAVARGSAMVVERDGHVSGYTTGIGFFGHAVAESDEDLKALIGAAREIAGPGFLLPTRNGNIMRWSLANGLRIVQPMTLMSMGEYVEPKGAWLPSILY
jgi:predicted N-acetyltransferase YhbS